MLNKLILAGMAATATMYAAGAQAHAHLTASTPAAESVGPAPKTLTLTFTEGLVGQFSGFDLAKGGMKVPVKVGLSPDGKSLVGAPAKPLSAGVYSVSWHTVTPDTHRLEGTYAFTVQ